jgi:chromosome segregation ATPase
MNRTAAFYEHRLVTIENEMKLCRIDMQDGNDYDYSQNRFDELVTERENVRLDLSSHLRRVENYDGRRKEIFVFDT